jgi:heptose I phosphotransferase
MRLINHNGLVINERFLELLKVHGLGDFESLVAYEGGTFLNKKRLRSVVRFELSDGDERKVFYLKRHFQPLDERLKSLLPWNRREGARNEWESTLLLTALGIPTVVPVAFGERGRFGIPYVSMTLTEGLYGAERVEEYLPGLSSRLSEEEARAEKRRLIKRLALLAKDFHNKGLNHQDFYLGHFFIRPETGELFLVDLQRVHKRKAISRRDRVKDLAQFAFSARSIENFTGADLVRFAHTYLGKDEFDEADKRMIKRVLKKSDRIARHTERLLSRRNPLNRPLSRQTHNS